MDTDSKPDTITHEYLNVYSFTIARSIIHQLAHEYPDYHPDKLAITLAKYPDLDADADADA